MNNYWHMMEQVTLSDRKKEDIMDMLENKGTQKRRMPKAGKLILAAALAVGCVLSIAAGLPAQVHDFLIGGTLTEIPGSNRSILAPSADIPVTLEDGRIMLTLNGKRLDITDKIDENTPYIVENTNGTNKPQGYLIAGGTPENFGWAEYAVSDGKITAQVSQNCALELVEFPDGSKVPLKDLTDAQRAQAQIKDGDFAGGISYTSINYPWLDAALEQLGLSY